MSPKREQTFVRGLTDGLPIALGYFSVSFAFGILAVQNGLPVWSPILISLTSFTGTGQFVGANLAAANVMLLQIAVTILVINLRYLLMSLSLSQLVEEDMPLWQRFLSAFSVTDEIFAVSIQRKEPLRFAYLMGLTLCAYTGWNLGTALGTFASSILPSAIRSSLGIAIYAMFVAIVVPPSRESKAISIVIAIAVIFSSVLHWTPGLNRLDDGWAILIAGVTAALLGAWLLPKKKKECAEDEN